MKHRKKLASCFALAVVLGVLLYALRQPGEEKFYEHRTKAPNAGVFPTYHIAKLTQDILYVATLRSDVSQVKDPPMPMIYALRRIDSGATVSSLQFREGSGSLRFSGDRKLFAWATSASDRGRVMVCDSILGSVLSDFKTGDECSVVALDGSRLGIVTWEEHIAAVEMWDWRDQKRLQRLPVGGRSHIFSEDLARVLVFSVQEPDKIYTSEEIESGKSKSTPSGPVKGEISLWDTKKEKRLWTRDFGDFEFIRNVAFTPTASRLLTLEHPQILRIRDAVTFEVIHTFDAYPGRYRTIATREFSPNGELLVTGHLYDPDPLTGSSWYALNPDFAPKWAHGLWRYLPRRRPDFRTTAKLWSMKTGELVRTLGWHHVKVLDAAFAEDDRKLATVDTAGTVRWWDVGDLVDEHAVGSLHSVVQ